MRAAVVTEYREPLVVQDLPDPIPGASDAIIQTRLAGFAGAIGTFGNTIGPGWDLRWRCRAYRVTSSAALLSKSVAK